MFAFRTLARSCLKAALVAAYVVAVGELVVGLAGGGAVPPFAAVRALEALIGLYGGFALVWGLGTGVVVEAMAHTLEPADQWRRVQTDAEYDRGWAAGLLAAALALGIVGVTVAAYDFSVAAHMAAPRNGALTTGAVAALSSLLALAIYFPLFRGARLICRLRCPVRAPSPLWARC